MSDWKTYKLGDAVEKLIDYRGKTPQKTSSGIPLITAKVIKNGRIEKPNEFIAVDQYENWMTRGIPEFGDVVLTTEAPLGEIAQIKAKCKVALAQRVIVLRGKINTIDNTYLKYFLLSPIGQSNLKAKETGSTVTGIKQSELRKVDIIAPEYKTQIKIAAILSAFDDKIELNLQMNQTLEAMAQAVFKEWFAGSTITSLSAYIDFNPRVTIKKDSVVKYVEMANLPIAGFSINSYIDRAFSSGSKFQLNDTLLARITPCLENGKTGFVDFLSKNETAFGSTEFIVMRAKPNISPYYVYFIARDPNFTEFAIKSMVGTSGRQRVQTDLLNSFQVSEINIESMDLFHRTVSPLFEKIKENSLQNQTLVQLRDNLLPRLMRGEIEI